MMGIKIPQLLVLRMFYVSLKASFGKRSQKETIYWLEVGIWKTKRIHWCRRATDLAMMTSTSTLNPSLRNRLTRYLHTGNELPKYYPGCWESHKYFVAERLTVIDMVLMSQPNEVEIANIIVKAYKDGWYTRFETLAFALAKCISVGNTTIKEACYKAALEICNTPEEMMMFNKFTRLLHTGNGRGWCRHVQEWYKRKDSMELAKEVTRVRGRHGRSHKTLLRKSHVKIDENDHARNAVVKYAIYGLKRAKLLCDSAEGTKEIFEYIQKVEDMRHCEDPAAAAEMAIQHHFTLDHIPGHLLTSQEVWNAILPELSLNEILYQIQRIHNMGFLTNDSDTTAILLSLLSNQDVIKKSKVTAIEVYITLCNYKKSTRPMKYEKAKVALEKQTRRRSRQIFNTKTEIWEWTVTRRHPKELKHWGIDQPPNQAVLVALTKLVDRTWLLTPPTNARYLITLDMRHHMFKGHMPDRYELLQLIMRGKVLGRRGVGRRKKSWLRNIREWTGIASAAELFRLAKNRQEFTKLRKKKKIYKTISMPFLIYLKDLYAKNTVTSYKNQKINLL
ncbi:jg12722 [Pararge aegeria aegeria]|uniref:Jg12722 protein n=1 Tax=Pararge aegeria aegeria TaxID=348720 RepID=A0A8S4S0H3_9NEOP|nr:jg12722 [Pararge aegeria aegeria]